MAASAARKRGHDVMALDIQGSVRSKDANGFLHVGVSNLTKEIVNPYYGREIPGWEELGLDPEYIYWGYRAGEELEKAAGTFSGLPLLMGHHIEDAEAPQREHRVGTVGTDARWDPPYVKAALVVTDADAIRAIEDGTARELSCAYRYEPDWTAGTFDGIQYDFVMRSIEGNHVALVEEGRAGSDVVVADAAPRDTLRKLEESVMKIFRKFRGAKDSDPATERQGVDLAQAIMDLHKLNPETGEVMDVTEDEEQAAAVKTAVDAIVEKLEPEEVAGLVSAMEAFGAPAAEDEDEPAADGDEPAADEDEPAAADEDAPAAADEDEPAQDEDEGKDVPAIDEDVLKAAADACGADADDPAFQAAFAEGVKYGEEHAAAADEDEPAAADEDAPAAAMDAALRKARTGIEARIMKKVRGLSAAAEAVRPVLGAIDPLAFDSATGIYGAALRKMGINPAKHPRAAWKSMYGIALDASMEASKPVVSSARKDYGGKFAGLNRVKRG